MTFADDERGQPVVIGALLIFTILVLAFAGYQAFAVPQQNAEVEFNHFQDVQSDFAELDSNLVNAVESGDTRSTSIDLGPQYPSRILALNPPPAAGSLGTTERGDVVISGTSDDICRDGGTPHTRSVVYQPGYAEFDNAESIVYENRFTGRQFREGNVFGDQRLVASDSDRINLLLLTGEVSDNGVGQSNVEISATGRYSTTVTNPTITLPSRFSAAEWRNQILSDRDDIDVSSAGANRVELDFPDRPFTVSCAVAGLNSEPAFSPPATAGSGDSGGGNGVGTGGSEEWSSSDTTRTISTQGGLWRDIGSVNSVVLSDPRLSPITSSGGESSAEERYFRTAITIGDPPSGERRFVLVMPSSTDGMVFVDDNGDGTPEFDSNKEVRLIREDSNGYVERFAAELSTAAVNDWYQNGEDLNLLDPNNYESPGDVEADLENVRSYLEDNGGQEAFITDVTGRVSLTIDDRFGTLDSATAESISTSDTEQQFTFTLSRDLTSGEEVRIDLGDPQASNQVDYRNANVDSDGPGTIDSTTQTNNAVITYTASGGENEGDTITVTVTDVDASGSQATRRSPYDVVFQGPTGDGVTTEFSVTE